jgi:hypothetical protein
LDFDFGLRPEERQWKLPPDSPHLDYPENVAGCCVVPGGNHDISQPHGPPRPVAGIALLFTTYFLSSGLLVANHCSMTFVCVSHGVPVAAYRTGMGIIFSRRSILRIDEDPCILHMAGVLHSNFQIG